jgi:O-antigen ligase
MITSQYYDRFNLKNILYYYSILAFIVALLIIVSKIFGYYHLESIYFDSRFSVGVTGVYKNPNYLASFIAVTIYLLLYFLFCIDFPFRIKIIVVLIVLILFYSIILTGTRAALLTVCIALIFSFWSRIRFRRSCVKIIIFCVIILIIVSGLFSNDMFNTLIGQRQGEFFEDVGRTEAWGMAVASINEKPLLGNGIRNTNTLLKSTDIQWLHNIFLQLINEQGFIGLILFILCLLTGYRRCKIQDKTFIIGFIAVTAFPMLFQMA